MKQIATGWLMYAEDFDNKLPQYNGPTALMGYVYPYVKSRQIFYCPSSIYRKTRNYDQTKYYGTDYGLPAINSTTLKAAVVLAGTVSPLSTVPEPSLTCLLGEVVNNGGGSLNLQTGFDRFNATNLTATNLSGRIVLDRHLEGANYAFMDGHAKWLKKEVALAPHAVNNSIQFYW